MFHDHMIAVTSLSEFLQLTQNLFQMDTNNLDVRSTVQDLFSSPKFGQFLQLGSTSNLVKQA